MVMIESLNDYYVFMMIITFIESFHTSGIIHKLIPLILQIY
jgi:hypothetical protein